MDKVNLLPCPFCGEYEAKTDRGNNGYLVICTHCKSNSGSYSKLENAVKAWNTRIIPSWND